MRIEPPNLDDLRTRIYSAIEEMGSTESLRLLGELGGEIPAYLSKHLAMIHTVPSPSSVMDCRLQQWFKVREYEPDVVIPAAWLKRAAAGVVIEPYWMAILSLAGLPVTLPDKALSCGPHMRAHPDGYIGDNALLELKDKTGWGYKRLIEGNGIAYEEPNEYMQCQLYLHASGRDWCLAPEHKILTADLQWISAGSVEVGDRLAAFDEQGPHRQWKTATVIGTSWKKSKVYHTELSGGKTFITTPQHRWLCGPAGRKHKWIETQNLSVGQSRALEVMEVWKTDTSWEAGFLAGAVDADGCLPNYADGSLQLVFSQNNNELLTRFLPVSSAKGFLFEPGGGLNYRLSGGKEKTAEFLGRFRPPRLLSKFVPEKLGSLWSRARRLVEYNQPSKQETAIRIINTDTGTLVADGMAMHNCLYLASPADPALLQSLMRQWKKYGKDYDLPLVYLEIVQKRAQDVAVGLERGGMIHSDAQSDVEPPREYDGVPFKKDGVTKTFPCGYCIYQPTCKETYG